MASSRMSRPAAPPATDTAPAAPAQVGMFGALREPLFRLLWIGMLPSMLAFQMGQVAVGYVAYMISGEAKALGWISAGWGVPMLFFALIGGVVADRVPKRTVILCSQTLIGTVAVVNAILILTDAIQVWHLVAASALQGTAFAFNMPSRQAFVAELVSKEYLTNAIALNNAGMNLMRVIGPALAGLLIAVAFIGPGGIFALMAGMYVIAITLIFRLPQGRPTRRVTAGGLSELRAGLRYVAQHPILRMLLILACVPVLLGMPYIQMMPVFAEDVFDVGSKGLGTLMAANGAGALLGSLGIAYASGLRRRGLLQLGLGVLFGTMLALFAFGRSFPLGLVAIAIAGLANAGYSTLNATLIMQHADQAFHGRVMSLYMITFSMMPLGSVPMAWLVDRFNAPTVIGIAGLALAAIIASVAATNPGYRRV